MNASLNKGDLVNSYLEGEAIVFEEVQKDLRWLPKHLEGNYFNNKGDDKWYGCYLIVGGYTVRPSCLLRYVGPTKYEDFLNAIEGAMNEVAINAIGEMFPDYKDMALANATRMKSDRFKDNDEDDD
jgi:hypothetical protein